MLRRLARGVLNKAAAGGRAGERRRHGPLQQHPLPSTILLRRPWAGKARPPPPQPPSWEAEETERPSVSVDKRTLYEDIARLMRPEKVEKSPMTPLGELLKASIKQVGSNSQRTGTHISRSNAQFLSPHINQGGPHLPGGLYGRLLGAPRARLLHAR